MLLAALCDITWAGVAKSMKTPEPKNENGKVTANSKVKASPAHEIFRNLIHLQGTRLGN